jgi:hypothetical protein
MMDITLSTEEEIYLVASTKDKNEYHKILMDTYALWKNGTGVDILKQGELLEFSSKKVA